MKRILFVDDEQNILDGLQNLLRKHRHEMDMVFALGGDAALSELEKAPVDVIVSDMRMSKMDGATLLGRVKAEHPGTVRIILSGHSDRDAILRALPVAHQFLSKPCEVDRLRNVLVRSCQLQTLLHNDSIRKALGRIERLPSLPGAYWELVRAFSDPNLSLRSIAEIVERDSAMCAKILQLVNSCCFGPVKSITGIGHAVSYLGMDLIKQLTLSANVFLAMDKMPACPGFSFEAVQTHALLTARVVKFFVSDPEQAQDAFTAALLHDVGYLVLASCDREQFRRVLEICATTDRPPCEVQTEVFGMTHAEAGAYLLNLWGLSFPLIEAVAYHHDPKATETKRFDLPSAIAVADVLVREAQEGGAQIPPNILRHLDDLGVASELPRWREIVAREVNDWKRNQSR